MSKITDIRIYGLNESIVAAGYPMRTKIGDINKDIINKKYPKAIDKLAMCKAGSGHTPGISYPVSPPTSRTSSGGWTRT